MLLGTDYNIGGFKGIGPKTALKLIKEHGNDFDGLFKQVEWSKYFDIDWEKIYYLFKKMPVEKNIKLKWDKLNKEKVYELLVEEHDFSKERVDNAIGSLMKAEEGKKQKGLGEWFK